MSRASKNRAVLRLVVPALVIFAGGTTLACSSILGLDDFKNRCDWDPSPGCAPGSGGSGGQGGNGEVCTPNATRPCYDGKDGTAGIGPCKLGVQTCDVSGLSWGKCLGEIVPKAHDDCTVASDDSNCSGKHDCVCNPAKDQQECYSGDQMTKGVGACKAGVQKCNADGQGYGTCTGEVVPAIMDDCLGNPQRDTTCDGKLDCSCNPGAVDSCYDGTQGTLGIGACKAGTHTCNPDGMGWGMCVGEVTDKPEDCATPVDDDCNGVVNDAAAGCVCIPGTAAPCWTGSAQTRNVGDCKDGMAQCDPSGKSYGACMGEVLPAQEKCNVAGDEDCDGLACSDLMWGELFGDAGGQEAEAVATDAQGNIVIAGWFNGTTNFKNNIVLNPAGGVDNFLAKLDPNGNVIWARGFGDANDQSVGINLDVNKNNGDIVISGYLAHTMDFGGGPLVAQSSYDVYIAVFDSAGNHKWSERFGNASTISGSGGVQFDAAGDVIAMGTYNGGAVSFGAIMLPASTGGYDGWVGKFAAKNPNDKGAPIWVTRIADGAAKPAGNQTPWALAHDSSSNVFVTGSFTGSIGLGKNVSSTGGRDGFLAKFDTLGNAAWVRTFGAAGNDDPSAINVDAGGNVVVYGTVSGSTDFGSGMPINDPGPGGLFLAKYSNVGIYGWAKIIDTPGASNVALYGLGIDSKADIVFIGSSSAMLDFGGGPVANPFLVKLDAQSGFLWSKQVAKATDTFDLNFLALDPNDNEVVTGGVYTSIDFGQGTLNAFAFADIVLAKFQP